MRVGLVAATTPAGVIGVDGSLPWSAGSGDLRYFRERTLGSAVIMGRRTAETLPRPLEDRSNLVLTRRAGGYVRDGFISCPTYEAALARAEDLGHDRVWVIGGAAVYRLAIRSIETGASVLDEVCLSVLGQDTEYDVTAGIVTLLPALAVGGRGRLQVTIHPTTTRGLLVRWVRGD